MDREAIKTYSYRISQATRSELVVIVYDIIRDYLNVLYNYMKRTLIGAQVSYDKNVVNSIYDMLGQLRQSFYEVSRQDNSAPLMKNTEKVYSGLTYSKYGAGNETASDTLINRGYMV